MFCSRGCLTYFATVESEDNLSGCVFREERVRVLLPEKELSEPSDNCPNIFKKSNIERYIAHHSAMENTVF